VVGGAFVTEVVVLRQMLVVIEVAIVVEHGPQDAPVTSGSRERWNLLVRLAGVK
jgi:hypothetical protein